MGFCTALFGALLLLAPAPEAPKTKPVGPSILLLPVHAGAGLTETAQALDDMVLATLREYSSVQLTTAADIQAMLGLERSKDVMGCDSIACSADIAGALNADYVLSGATRGVGDNLQLSLRLVAARNSRIVGAEVGDVHINNTAKLRGEVRALMRSVLSYIGLAASPNGATLVPGVAAELPPPQPHAPSSRAYVVTTWVFTGLTAAALSVGAWQGLVARGLYTQETKMTGTDPALQNVITEGKRASIIADGSFIGAAASAITAGILWWQMDF